MAVYMIFTIIMVNDSNSLLRLTRIKVLIIVGPAPIAAVPFWVPKGQNNKQGQFFYWHSALIDMAGSVFQLVHVNQRRMPIGIRVRVTNRLYKCVKNQESSLNNLRKSSGLTLSLVPSMWFWSVSWSTNCPVFFSFFLVDQKKIVQSQVIFGQSLIFFVQPCLKIAHPQISEGDQFSNKADQKFPETRQFFLVDQKK